MLILSCDFYVLFLQIDELFVDGFEATFELLYFGLIGIKERDECEFVIV